MTLNAYLNKGFFNCILENYHSTYPKLSRFFLVLEFNNWGYAWGLLLKEAILGRGFGWLLGREFGR
jgi:hypothetical protein